MNNATKVGLGSVSFYFVAFQGIDSDQDASKSRIIHFMRIELKCFINFVRNCFTTTFVVLRKKVFKPFYTSVIIKKVTDDLLKISLTNQL